MKIASAALGSLVPVFAFLLEGVAGAGRDAHESLRGQDLFAASVQRKVAAVTRYDVCHKTDEVDPNGDPIYKLIQIPDPAYADHAAHGDAHAGKDVPDPCMSGKMFDEQCNVVENTEPDPCATDDCPCFSNAAEFIEWALQSTDPDHGYKLIATEDEFPDTTYVGPLLVVVPYTPQNPEYFAVSYGLTTDGPYMCGFVTTSPPFPSDGTEENYGISEGEHACCSQLIRNAYSLLCCDTVHTCE